MVFLLLFIELRIGQNADIKITIAVVFDALGRCSLEDRSAFQEHIAGFVGAAVECVFVVLEVNIGAVMQLINLFEDVDGI